MADLFLSYKREERARVEPLVAALKEAGWSVFWDAQIETGESYHRRIDRELNEAKCVVVVWSKSALDSEWVLGEASKGSARGVLVQVKLDDVELLVPFNAAQCSSLMNWKGGREDAEFVKLKQAIARHVGRVAALPVVTTKPPIETSWLARLSIGRALLTAAGGVALIAIVVAFVRSPDPAPNESNDSNKSSLLYDLARGAPDLSSTPDLATTANVRGEHHAPRPRYTDEEIAAENDKLEKLYHVRFKRLKPCVANAQLDGKSGWIDALITPSLDEKIDPKVVRVVQTSDASFSNRTFLDCVVDDMKHWAVPTLQVRKERAVPVRITFPLH